MRNKNIKRSII